MSPSALVTELTVAQRHTIGLDRSRVAALVIGLFVILLEPGQEAGQIHPLTRTETVKQIYSR